MAAGPAPGPSNGKWNRSQLVRPAGFSWPQSGQRVVSGIGFSFLAADRPTDYRERTAAAANGRGLAPRRPPRAPSRDPWVLDPHFFGVLACGPPMRHRLPALAALLALTLHAAPARAETAHVTLLHTTDLHGALTDYDYLADRPANRGLV